MFRTLLFAYRKDYQVYYPLSLADPDGLIATCLVLFSFYFTTFPPKKEQSSLTLSALWDLKRGKPEVMT